MFFGTLKALTAMAVVGVAGRWACFKSLVIHPSVGCKVFEVEISAPGYWARCEYDLTTLQVGPNTTWSRISPFNCVGNTFNSVNYELTGSPKTLEVPCTLFSEKVRITCGDRVVFDGPVTSECDGPGLCIF